MFTLQDVFNSAFPFLEGISWDVGTLITGMLFITFIIIGFDYIKDILSSYYCSMSNSNKANFYYEQAKKYRNSMSSLNPDSIGYEEASMLYKANLRQSVRYRVAGGASPGGFGSSSKSDWSLFDDDNSDRRDVDRV